MLTRFVGWIFTLVIIAAFLPLILEAIGWVVGAIVGGVAALILLGFLLRLLRPNRPTKVYIYDRR